MSGNACIVSAVVRESVGLVELLVLLLCCALAGCVALVGWEDGLVW